MTTVDSSAALTLINAQRAQHSAAPLRCGGPVTDYAQAHANFCADKNLFQHSRGPYGENLYMGSHPDASSACTAAVQLWYGEAALYDWNAATFSMTTGHFTASCWKGSRFIGMGAARGANGMWTVVASFNPPGNMMGAFRENVSPRHT